MRAFNVLGQAWSCLYIMTFNLMLRSVIQGWQELHGRIFDYNDLMTTTEQQNNPACSSPQPYTLHYHTHN